MRAAVLDSPTHLTVREIPDPEPGPNEVVVAVSLAGICGTDYSLYQGKFDVPFPVVPGHEGMGVVKEIGPGVANVSEGQRVVIQPNFPCGRCPLCYESRGNVCAEKVRLGLDIDGVFAQYVKVPADYVWPIPDGLDDRTAALAEPLAVAVHSLKLVPPTDGDRILIVGAGVIGLLTLLLVNLEGADLAISDLLEQRLSFAKRLGAGRSFRVGGDRRPEPASFDLIYETSGGASAFSDAVDLAAPGGRIALLGLPGQDHPVSTSQIVRKELAVTGSMIYTDEFPEVIEMLNSRRVDPAPLISDVITLDSLDQAIKAFHSPDRIKVLVSI